MSISRRVFLASAVPAAGASTVLQLFKRDVGLEEDGELELRPDDVFVIRVPDHFDQLDVQGLVGAVRRTLGVEVLVLAAGVELEVVRRLPEKRWRALHTGEFPTEELRKDSVYP